MIQSRRTQNGDVVVNKIGGVESPAQSHIGHRGGDVAGASTAASEQITGKHGLMGSGGATEGVRAAGAGKGRQGDRQGKL